MSRRSKKRKDKRNAKLRLTEEVDLWRDRKKGSFNQLWDWNTLENVEIKTL